jgi:hypothetical protein
MMFLSGCGNPGKYQEPIAKLTDATKKTVDVCNDYLFQDDDDKCETEHATFKFKLELYIDKYKLELNPLQETGFNKKGLELRKRILAELLRYVSLLDSIANSDAGDNFKKNTASIADELNGVAGKIGEVTGDETLKKYKEPVTKLGGLAGTLGELWVNNKREKAIEDALIKGAPIVKDIIEILKGDVNIAYEKRKELYQRIVMAEDEIWECNCGKLCAEFRRAQLDRILKAKVDLHKLTQNNPSVILDSLIKTLEKAENYASKKNTKNEEEAQKEMFSQIDTFHSVVEQFYDLYKSIKAIN